uniref:Glycosyltransferase n=1 Tax=viral metagenome TaxID=1070528 RepID=A0A6C0LFS1_9ZZZZ
MIGFLFLTYDAICKEDIWFSYFKNVNCDHYKIFVHPKNANEIRNQNFFKNCIIPSWCETDWGNFSLIEAQKLLIEEALKHSNITHFVFVSNNAIPVTSFYQLYNFLQTKKSIIGYGKTTIDNHTMRYDKLQHKPIFSKEQFLIQSQWCILSRHDATILVEEHNEIKKLFNNSWIPDEHAYVNYLVYYKNITDIENKSTTYIEWDNGKPSIFYSISNEEINRIRNEGKFFIRKICDSTWVDVNYLLQQ